MSLNVTKTQVMAASVARSSTPHHDIVDIRLEQQQLRVRGFGHISSTLHHHRRGSAQPTRFLWRAVGGRRAGTACCSRSYAPVTAVVLGPTMPWWTRRLIRPVRTAAWRPKPSSTGSLSVSLWPPCAWRCGSPPLRPRVSSGVGGPVCAAFFATARGRLLTTTTTPTTTLDN